ncbi:MULTISPECIES: hypothetical protein [unclassified Lactobacillus]|uniref:hypothetical protein n=1 Tax=unclassified Lactobacillus TaxID=2620435 RepID=UPI001314F326|nr:MULTISPECIES: hypothetical protein [unclassified Lactobacillus]
MGRTRLQHTKLDVTPSFIFNKDELAFFNHVEEKLTYIRKSCKSGNPELGENVRV